MDNPGNEVPTAIPREGLSVADRAFDAFVSARAVFGEVSRENSIIVVCPAFFMLAALLIERIVGTRESKLIVFRWIDSWFNDFVAWYLLLYLGIFLWNKILQENLSVHTIAHEIKTKYLTPARFLGSILGYCLLAPFFSAFSGLKVAIPAINPFSWDACLMQIDRLIHFGYHPWVLLHKILAVPIITKLIDVLYILWFHLLYAVPLWMAVTHRRRLRAHFFLSFFSVWIVLGVVFATILSSAGPCYYEKIAVGLDPYEPLMEYLESVHREYSPLFSLYNQERLWDAYINGARLPYGGGISAMPSLHVAVSVLYVLLAWRVNRVLGFLFAAYAFVIQIGSVHLGWHYAVDGYFSAVFTFLIWTASDRILRFLGWQEETFHTQACEKRFA